MIPKQLIAVKPVLKDSRSSSASVTVVLAITDEAYCFTPEKYSMSPKRVKLRSLV